MAKVFNRVRVTTTTTGTGTITLGPAVAGYRTLAAAGAADGDEVHYTIENGTAWEIGIGTYSTTGPTLSRFVVESSTGSLLNLTSGANVFVSGTAAAIQSDVEITGGMITGTTISGGTISGIAPIAITDGGTGTGGGFLPYAVLLGGTTAGNPLQNVSGLGNSGQVLTSNGADTLPSWQTRASNLRAALYTSSSNWTAPAGCTRVRITIIGGGGGGAQFSTAVFSGGFGAVAVGEAQVVPGTTYTVTVGAGGNGSNTGSSTAGGNSSFGSFVTAFGGQPGTTSQDGTDGSVTTGTGFTLFRSGNVRSNQAYVSALAGPMAAGMFFGPQRNNAAGLASGIPFTPSGDSGAGVAGKGETAATANDATGGTGGVVFLEWVE